MDPPEFMLAPQSMTDVEYDSWGVFPMLSGFLRGWTIRSLTSLALCLPLLFRYILNLFFSSFFFLFVITSNVRNCNKGELLLVSPLILHIFLGQSMLMAWMALLKSVVPRNPNVMGYHFPLNTRVVSSFFPLSFLFLPNLSFSFSH